VKVNLALKIAISTVNVTMENVLVMNIILVNGVRTENVKTIVQIMVNAIVAINVIVLMDMVAKIVVIFYVLINVIVLMVNVQKPAVSAVKGTLATIAQLNPVLTIVIITASVILKQENANVMMGL